MNLSKGTVWGGDIKRHLTNNPGKRGGYFKGGKISRINNTNGGKAKSELVKGDERIWGEIHSPEKLLKN